MVIKNFEALNLSLEHYCNFCCVSLSVVSSITRDICNKERRGSPIMAAIDGTGWISQVGLQMARLGSAGQTGDEP